MGLMRIKFSMEMTSAGQAKLIAIGGREGQRGVRAQYWPRSRLACH
jgi:hypothetical protein